MVESPCQTRDSQGCDDDFIIKQGFLIDGTASPIRLEASYISSRTKGCESFEHS